MSRAHTIGFLFFVFCIVFSATTAHAAYDTAAPGDTIRLGEFVYDDDYTATTTPCTMSVFDPTGTTIVNAQSMTSEATGWHYYDVALDADAANGVWPAHMVCGSTPTGDLIKVDKSFSVGNTISSTSSIASAVWSNTSRTLSSFGTLVADTVSGVWGAATRRLTSGDLDSGSLATVADVQTTVQTSVQSASSSLAAAVAASTNTINAVIGAASSSLSSQILTNQSLITSLNNISATDVWAAASRTLTSGTLSSGSLATVSDIQDSVQTASTSLAAAISAGTASVNNNTNSVVSSASSSLAAAITTSAGATPTSIADEVWNRASAELSTAGSIGRLLTDNIDAQISTRGTSSLTAIDIWSAATRTLTDYATSSVADAAALAVWSNGTRALTDYGNNLSAADVWNSLTSSLTSVGSVGKLLADNIDTTISSRASLETQNAQWFVTMSDYSSVQAGKTYRARVQVLNSASEATDPFAAPTVTLYDAERNMTVSAVSMTHVGIGLYEYTYSVASAASQGVWETVASTQVESGKIITNNDYWLVAGSPAQVIINSVTASSISDISANVTITNEGLAGYEYQYEWCVVDDLNNRCGGGDDAYHATGAKFINPGEDWNTNLTATVNEAGSYYFKLVVYFGTEQSGSSRTFTVTGDTVTPPTPPSSGGGGGGSPPRPTPGVCRGADFNHDNFVNSIDFSILLSYWRTIITPANPCVDINRDNAVDAVDFSILLSQWGTAGRAL